jgi:hypothetical protein
MNEQRLIPGAVARGIVLPLALQDDVHHHQDVAYHAQVSGDHQDGRHANVH